MKKVTDPEVLEKLGVQAQDITQPDPKKPKQQARKMDVRGPEFMRGMDRSFVEGMTFGFGDEIGLGGAAAAGYLWNKLNTDVPDQSLPEIYSQMRQSYNQQQGEFSQAHPVASTLGTVAGGLTTGGLIGKQALTQAQKLKSLAPIAKSGAKVGAVSGAGFAPDIESIPGYMLMGAGTGAVLPYGIQGAAALGKGVYGAGKGLLNSMRHLLPDSSTPAVKSVARAFQRDQIPINKALSQMKELGDESVLADVGGENVKKLAQHVASLPGKSAQAAERTLQSRMNRSASRLIGTLQKSLGTNKSAYQTSKALINKRKAAAAPLYKEAFKKGVDPDKAVDLIDGINDMASKAQGTKLGSSIKSVATALTKRDVAKGVRAPKLGIEELHWAKMDLDDKIGSALRSGNKTLASQLMDIKRGLLSVMDDVPEYAAARSEFAGDSAILSAVDKGRQILKTNTEEMADLLPNMTKAEWDGYVVGAVDAISNTLKGGKIGSNTARRLATPLLRDRLRGAFPDDDTFNQFMRALDREEVFAELRNFTIRNSPTQPRIGTGRELAVDASVDAVQGRWLSGVMNSVGRWLGQFKNIPEPVRDDIGELLFSDLAKHNQVSKKLLNKMAKQQIRKEQVEEFIRGINAIGTETLAISAPGLIAEPAP